MSGGGGGSDAYGEFLRSPEDALFVEKVQDLIKSNAVKFDRVTTWDGKSWDPMELVDHLCRQALDYDKDSETFSAPYTVEGDATVETASDSSGATIFRIRKEMPGKRESIMDLVTKAQHLGDMDHTVRVLKPVHSFDERTRLVYNVTRIGSIFWDRDFFDFVCEREVDGALVSCAVSVPTSLPDCPGLVRGWTMKWGLVMRNCSRNPNKSNLTLVCQAHVNGWMPMWLTNMATGQVLAKNYIGEIENRLTGRNS